MNERWSISRRENAVGTYTPVLQCLCGFTTTRTERAYVHDEKCRALTYYAEDGADALAEWLESV